MFDLLTSRPGIDLFSIHIPKTAGMSFRNILKGVYGKQGVVMVNIPIPEDAPRLMRGRRAGATGAAT